MRSQFLILAIAATCACSPPDQPTNSAALRAPASIRFQAGYFADDGTAIESESLPKAIGVHAVPIPGNIFGAPVFPALASVYVHTGEPSVLDLGSAESQLKSISTPLTEDGLKAGLRVNPPDARLARLGIFVANADTGKGVPGYASLIGPSKEIYSIVYFDRPCVLSGVAHSEGKTVTYDIQILSPGIQLLAMAKVSPATFVVSRAEPQNLITLNIVPSKVIVSK